MGGGVWGVGGWTGEWTDERTDICVKRINCFGGGRWVGGFCGWMDGWVFGQIDGDDCPYKL